MISSIIMGPKFPLSLPPKNPKKILKIFGRVLQVGKKFLDILLHGDDVKDVKPMNEKNSTADEIMKLNSILLEYKQSVSKESKELELEIKEVCKAIFEQIVESVEFANTEFQFYRIETLQRKLNNYLSDIDGVFEKHVVKRISLDDMECTNVLKMLPGELKGQRMAELKKRVFNEAICDLCQKMEDFQKDISESMEMVVDDKLKSLEEMLEERRNAFEKMSTETGDIEVEKEKVCLKAEYTDSVIKLFEQYMEGEM